MPGVADGEQQSSEQRLEAAAAAAGVAALFPYQRLVGHNILAGRQQLVVLPTGSGKSNCFAIPARLLSGPTLVVVPLLALLDDLRRRLSGDLPVAVLKGGQSASERRSVYRLMRTRTPSIVLTTPESLTSKSVLAALAGGFLSHLVVDEAHCVAEWGDTFRPSYLALATAVAHLRPRVVTAFTATASEAITVRIREVLFVGRTMHLVRGNPDRANLFYRVTPVLSRHQLLAVVASTMPRPLLAFAATRAATEVLARELRQHLRGRTTDGSVRPEEIRFYHAGLDDGERRETEAWYLHSPDGVLVATSAYGMGVDKGNIRTVLHLDPPASPEAYLQETGRAGRDGDPATAILALQPRTATAATPATWALYGRDGFRCRRMVLLESTSPLPVACGGCDVCAGEVQREPAGYAEVAAAVRIGRGRWHQAQLEAFLAGGPHRLLAALGERIAARAGALREWSEAARGEAIDTLVAIGVIRVGRQTGGLVAVGAAIIGRDGMRWRPPRGGTPAALYLTLDQTGR